MLILVSCICIGPKQSRPTCAHLYTSCWHDIDSHTDCMALMCMLDRTFLVYICVAIMLYYGHHHVSIAIIVKPVLILHDSRQL